ncbi:MAG: Ig-like domain-containing protein, partial [Luminiphilus sp.]|nr:Ig-like domain-containing protein [Luminiphilus sp.]
MAQFVGTISKLSGAVSARAADAGTRMLELGDDVCEGEVLVTSDEALVEVMFQDAPPIVLTGGRELLLNGEVTAAGRDSITDAVLAGETPELLATAEDGEIDFNRLIEEEATAAGAQGDGSSFIRLGRIGFGPEPLEASGAGAPASASAGDSSAFDNDLALLVGGPEDPDPEDPDPVPPTPQTPNESPNAIDDTVSVPFGESITVSVLENDTDPENDPLTVTEVGEASFGAVTINEDGTVTYVPNADFSGEDQFPYTISDGNGGTDTAIVFINVNDPPPTPTSPDAVDDDYVVAFEGSLSGNVILENDSDPEGDALTITSNTSPQFGNLTLNTDGSFIYIPNDDFSGSDQFTYTISDGNGNQDTATVRITVSDPPANDPVAVDDSVTTAFEAPVTISVLDNDSDPDNDPLSVVSNTGTTNGGTVVANPDGTFTYTPADNFTGTDSFDYKITDGNGGEDTATVTIQVGSPPPPPPSPPDAVDDSVTTAFGAPITISVLDNDSDPDNDPLSVVSNTGSTNGGTVVANPDGTFTYTPANNFTGTDTFSYTISDGNGGEDTATVTIQVGSPPPPSPPDAVDDSATTAEDTAVTFSLTANDTDPDGDLDVSTVTIVSGPSNGSLQVNADGSVTYTPNADYNGADIFTYTVADALGQTSNVATVNLQVSSQREVAAFTDNWVNGVEYAAYASEAAYLNGEPAVAQGLTGDQGRAGSFSFLTGEFIVFKIGAVIVGEFGVNQLSGDILFIHDIAGIAMSNTNSDQLENTAIFLQALDDNLADAVDDGVLETNAITNSDTAFTDGITITEDVRVAFAGYVDPTTGEPLDLQNSGKVQVSDALETQDIEFTRATEADPDEIGPLENVFETEAIDHVTETVTLLAGTPDGGFDAREEDKPVDGVTPYAQYVVTGLDTEDGNDGTAQIAFDRDDLLNGAQPNQVIYENLEIEFRGASAGKADVGDIEYQTTDAQITINGATRIVGTVFFNDDTGQGFIQLDPYDPVADTGITTAEIQSGALFNLEFGYTVWDWTAAKDFTIPLISKSHLAAEITNVVEGELIEFELTSSVTFDTDEKLTVKFSPEGNGFNFAEYADDFIVPIEYSTDGGATWQVMVTAPDPYFAPPYPLPLPVFEFTLPAGSDSVLVRIQTFDDVTDEDPAGSIDPVSGQGIEVIDMLIEGDSDKFFEGNFADGAPASATFQPGIIDNDPSAPAPYIDVNFVQVYEHDGNGVFTITLYDANGNVAVADSAVTITYNTTNLSAQAGSDYQSIAGTATIVAGASSVTVSVPIIDDDFVEPTEIALLDVTVVSGQLGGIDVINSDPQGTLRIYDNDNGVFSVADTTVVEGDVVTGQGAGVLVTVTRFGAGPEQGDQTVTVSTLPISGSDTAQAEDFTAITNVVLTFAPGVTTQTVFIPINDDLLIETPETFRVELSNPTGEAVIAQPGLAADDGVAVVTIIDNDLTAIR